MMRSTLIVLMGLVLGLVGGCGSGGDRIVEASCGQCRFGMAGDGCDLAVRFDGGAWFVDGSGIDDHGDAHASDGLCNAVRRARVRGEVVDGRFVAEEFVLID